MQVPHDDADRTHHFRSVSIVGELWQHFVADLWHDLAYPRHPRRLLKNVQVPQQLRPKGLVARRK
jgi:hypothetical protein